MGGVGAPVPSIIHCGRGRGSYTKHHKHYTQACGHMYMYHHNTEGAGSNIKLGQYQLKSDQERGVMVMLKQDVCEGI